MKRKGKHTGTIYTYLDKTGILVNGSDAEIREMKRKYWAEYKKRWVQQKRRAEKEFTVRFTVKEVTIITSAAKQHGRSSTRFIKEAALAYINKRYLVPDVIALIEIRELLALNYNAFQRLFQESLLSYEVGIEVRERLTVLEREVLIRLQYPKTVEGDS